MRQHLATLVISIALSLMVAECLIRLLFPIYDPSGMVSFRMNEQNVPLGTKNFVGRQWKNTGDFDVSVRINPDGFRDTKILSSSKNQDWLLVGDSFSFGMGVEEQERFSNLLEKSLKIKIFNISIPGAGLSDYQKLIAYAKTRGANCQNLIVGFCMENDLDYENSFLSEDEKSKSNTAFSFLYSAKQWLTEHSAFYNMMTSFIHKVSFLKNRSQKLGLIVGNEDGVGLNILDEEALSDTAKKVAKLTEGFQALVVVIPSRALWIGKNQEIEKTIHQKLIQKFRTLGLEVIDLKESFEADQNPMGFHFKNDPHWNKMGHQKAASVIAKFIQEKR